MVTSTPNSKTLLRPTSSMELMIDGISINNLNRSESFDLEHNIGVIDMDMSIMGIRETGTFSIMNPLSKFDEDCTSDSMDYGEIYGLCTASDDIITAGEGIKMWNRHRSTSRNELKTSSKENVLVERDDDDLSHVSLAIAYPHSLGAEEVVGLSMLSPTTSSLSNFSGMDKSLLKTTSFSLSNNLVSPSTKRGYMLKLSTFRTWKIRFFVLEGGYLYHYVSMDAADKESKENNLQKQGEMCLRNVQITEAAGATKGNTSFILRVMDYKGQAGNVKNSNGTSKDNKGIISSLSPTLTNPKDKTAIHLDVRVPSDRQEWIVALNQHIAYQNTLASTEESFHYV